MVYFDWVFNWVNKKGLLIIGFQYFDSWILLVSFRRSSGQIRVQTLVTSIRNAIYDFSNAEGTGEMGKACRSHICQARAS